MAAPRQFRQWLLCLWPSLPGTWHSGQLSSLMVAVAFGLAAQLVLVLCFVWPEMLQRPLSPVVCFCVALFWGAGVVKNLVKQSRQVRFDRPNRADHLFQSAQREYLRGDWEAAERTLRRLLDRHSTDVEARLLLATVYRRWQRTADATRELDRLAEMPLARSWTEEIRRERSYGTSTGSEQPNIKLADLDAA